MRPAAPKGAMPLTKAMRRINAEINRQPSSSAARRRPAVFVSYSSADTDRAGVLVADLADAGFSPWWAELLAGGEAFRDAIVERIDAADAVVVLWSADSVRSGWVEAEAKRAHEQGKLVPVRLGRLATGDIPPPYSALQTLLVDDVDAIRHAIERLVATRMETAASMSSGRPRGGPHGTRSQRRPTAA